LGYLPPTRAGTSQHSPQFSAVVPWSSQTSRRGRPKQIGTDGFTCPNPACEYFQITDALLHALVDDGKRDKHEPIQHLRCQASHTSFSSRRDTPLYRLKTPSSRVAEVLTALAEGLDLAAATRVFGYRHTTISAWLRRAGQHGAALHKQRCCNLKLGHIQLDEICTQLRSRKPKLWLWLATQPVSKLVPVLQLGMRTQDVAHSVIHELHQRLAADCLPLFTSDGLNLYFYALTAHFGSWVESAGRRARRWQVGTGLLYAQVKKRYRRHRLVRVRPLMRCGEQEQLCAGLKQLGLSGRINTAFVERLNLTVRQSMAPLARRSWSTAQQASQLLLHLELWHAYYHYVRPHQALRQQRAQAISRGGKRHPSRYRHRTPAMAAGLTSHRWTKRELLMLPLPRRTLGIV
jgi:transposase-like protein